MSSTGFESPRDYAPQDLPVHVDANGDVWYTAHFAEKYTGHPPERFMIAQQDSPLYRDVQEYCNTHGTDVHVTGVFENMRLKLGVYKHNRNNRCINGRMCYELFLWMEWYLEDGNGN